MAPSLHRTVDLYQYAESIAAAVSEPLLVLDSELRVVAANQAFCDTFRVTPGETEGKLLDDLDGGQWAIPRLQELLRGILPGTTTLEGFEVKRDFPRIGRRIFALSARPERHARRTRMVLLTLWDVTNLRHMEEALREYEELSRTILESATVGVYIVEDGRLRYVNPHIVERSGYSREELVGSRPSDHVHPEDRDTVRREARRQLEGQSTIPYEFRLTRKDRRTLWMVEMVCRIHRRGKPATLGILMDITDHKEAEEALRESESRYRLLADNATDLIWTADPDLSLTYVSPSVENILGQVPEDLVGRPLDHLLPERSTGPVRDAVARLLARRGKKRGAGTTVELEHQHRDGSPVWLEVSISIMRDIEGEPAGLMGVARDISERKLAEQRLEAYQRRLRSLASRLSLAEERERKRLATGLHDLVGQPLAALRIKLGALREHMTTTGQSQQLDEAEQLLQTAIQATRSLTFDLSPPILYQLGLEAALEWLAEHVQNAYGLVCGFEDDGQPKPLGDDARGLLFREVRELLMNVVKHASAHAAVVSIRRAAGAAEVTVEDDGVGFDTSELERGTAGFGLFSIRQRITEFGGRVEVHSAPGQGTQVTLAVPLDNGNGSARS